MGCENFADAISASIPRLTASRSDAGPFTDLYSRRAISHRESVRWFRLEPDGGRATRSCRLVLQRRASH
jgi:hypothetical protein